MRSDLHTNNLMVLTDNEIEFNKNTQASLSNSCAT